MGLNTKEMEKNEIVELCQAFGFLSIPSKNPYMISFRQEETSRRLNVYFTNMTVTIEDENHRQFHYRKVTLEELEKLIA